MQLNNNDLLNIDKKINNCSKCLELVEKFPNSPTVYLGVNNDIILIGEAPANNGWRKSHMLWRNEEGKILPSGVILQKLFDIVDKSLFDITFLEAVKCYPRERKNLKKCSLNCKDFMFEQLKILNPKLIITLGEFPTRVLLDTKFEKYSQVVGKLHNSNSFNILPIYHPSPVSPMSYKGNIPIFEYLSELLQEEKIK